MSVGVDLAIVDIVVVGVDSDIIDTVAVGKRNAVKDLTGLLEIKFW